MTVDSTLEYVVPQRESPTSAPALVIAYVVLLSFLPPLLVVPGLGAAGRPAALFSLGLATWWALERILPNHKPVVAVPLKSALYVYLVVFLAAVAAGLDRGLPTIESNAMDRTVLLLIGYSGLVLVSSEGLRSVDDLERVLTWLVAGAAASVAVAIIQFGFAYDVTALVRPPGLVFNADIAPIATRGGPGFARVRGFAAHPIEYGVVLGTLLPIAVHLATYAHRRRGWRWVAVGLIGGGIPLSISRSAIIALAVGMGVMALGWSWRQRFHALSTAFVGAIAFMVITPGLLGTIKALFLNVGTDDSVSGRTQDYDAIGAFVRDRPLLGRGPGTFVPTEYRYVDNEYLITLLHMGWVGLLSLLLVLCTALATTIRLARRATSQRERSLAYALGAGITTALAVFATFDALGFPIYAGVLVIVLACIGALDRIRRTPQAAPAIFSEE